MENNLMKYNINELKHLYIKTDNNFKKFFIKKMIDYKIRLLKNENKNKNENNTSNITHKKDTLDDLIVFSNNDPDNDFNNNSSESDESNDMANNDTLNNTLDNSSINNEKSEVEEKFVKQIKFDTTSNKLLERLNVESNFRSRDRQHIKKQFASPFAEDNLYNEQFKNDKYIESVNKIK